MVNQTQGGGTKTLTNSSERVSKCAEKELEEEEFKQCAKKDKEKDIISKVKAQRERGGYYIETVFLGDRTNDRMGKERAEKEETGGKF